MEYSLAISDKNKLLRVFHGQSSEERRVKQAEDRRVRADPQRQRERGDDSEAGILRQHPRAKTQVLNHLVLPSFGLQPKRVPEGAQAPPQQFKFVPPIEPVP